MLSFLLIYGLTVEEHVVWKKMQGERKDRRRQQIYVQIYGESTKSSRGEQSTSGPRVWSYGGTRRW